MTELLNQQEIRSDLPYTGHTALPWLFSIFLQLLNILAKYDFVNYFVNFKKYEIFETDLHEV